MMDKYHLYAKNIVMECIACDIISMLFYEFEGTFVSYT